MKMRRKETLYIDFLHAVLYWFCSFVGNFYDNSWYNHSTVEKQYFHRRCRPIERQGHKVKEILLSILNCLLLTTAFTNSKKLLVLYRVPEKISFWFFSVLRKMFFFKGNHFKMVSPNFEEKKKILIVKL